MCAAIQSDYHAHAIASVTDHAMHVTTKTATGLAFACVSSIVVVVICIGCDLTDKVVIAPIRDVCAV